MPKKALLCLHWPLSIVGKFRTIVRSSCLKDDGVPIGEIVLDCSNGGIEAVNADSQISLHHIFWGIYSPRDGDLS